MNFHKFNECLISTQIKREWEKKRKRIRQKGLKKKGKGENERGERRKGEKTKGKKGREGGAGPASACLCSRHLTPRVQ